MTIASAATSRPTTVADAVAAARLLLDRHPPKETDPREFWGAQFDAGLAWVDFPVGAGGLGLPAEVQDVVDQQLRAAHAPTPDERNLIGVQMMAPTVVQFGSPDQRRRFLRPAFCCEEIWCQLFSEPGAGSDLASLATRADRRGDGWVLNGQKVWTTLAHLADRAICLVRTDRDVPKHRGLTFFAIDMRAPGVDVRPLRQISGEAEYNEVFLTDVMVADSDRIGELGSGWKVAMSTLTSERKVVGSMVKGAAMDNVVSQLSDAWDGAPETRRGPVWRERLAELWTEAQVLRLTAERDALPAPMIKTAYGEFARRAAAFCVDIRGGDGQLVDHYNQTQPTTFTHVGGAVDTDAHHAKRFLAAQALTIAGGTSQVNRNIVGERVLGLPPEPRSQR